MSSATSSPNPNPNPNPNAKLVHPANNTFIALKTQNSTKLNGNNYPTWRVQLNALLVGYDLIGFVDGTTTCLAANHQDYRYRRRQDQLILYAIISSVDQTVVTMLRNVKTSKQAWDTLNKLFASKTRHRMLYLKDRLSQSFKGTQSMAQYLHGIKAVVDELAIIHCQIDDDDDDLVIHTLNGLGSEYREVFTAICARENSISFDELHDMLTDYEAYLNRDAVNSQSSVIAIANAT